MTAAWWQGPLLGFDTETTGVDVWTDRIVTTALVDTQPGQRPVIDTQLVNPGVPIPAGATAVHGVTTEHAAAHGRPPAQVLFEVTGRLALAMTRGVPVVVFNGSFDLTLLEAENRRHGLPTLTERLDGRPVGPVVDVHVLDKHADRYRKGGRKLADTARHYGVALSADGAHDAGADALAACRMLIRLMAAHPKLATYGLVPLHEAQAGWRATQLAGLAAYFRRKGEHEAAASCEGEAAEGWPVRVAALGDHKQNAATP